MPTIPLKGCAGMKIRAGDGFEQQGFPEMMSTPLYYFAQAGDTLRLINHAYKFNVATYSLTIDPRWIYTYDYAPDQSWTVYRGDLSGETYRQADYIFRDDCYFRVCLRKTSGKLFSDSDDINEILVFDKKSTKPQATKPWITNEAKRAASRVNELRTSDSLVFALFSDTHYVVNGTWHDTAESLGKMHELVNFDGIVHLGDITDGMVTSEATKAYASIVLHELKIHGIPVGLALGNHDSNYFRGNPQGFSHKEQRDFYFDGGELHYCMDYEAQKLRLIFLDSFDFTETMRYGYSKKCTAWLEQTLSSTSTDWRVIIFSHLPPVTRLQFWAKEVRGEEEIRRILHIYSNKIIAWINGHNHADRIDHVESIPIVSTINTKCEAFTEHKPTSYITPERKLDTATQEAWDIMIVNQTTINFVRFGAGDDRIIKNRKAEWL